MNVINAASIHACMYSRKSEIYFRYSVRHKLLDERYISMKWFQTLCWCRIFMPYSEQCIISTITFRMSNRCFLKHYKCDSSCKIKKILCNRFVVIGIYTSKNDNSQIVIQDYPLYSEPVRVRRTRSVQRLLNPLGQYVSDSLTSDVRRFRWNFSRK